MGLENFLAFMVLLDVTLWTEVSTKNVRKTIFVKSFNGHHCPTETGMVKLSDVPLYLCTHYCISELQCSMLSFHVNNGVCMVHEEVCVEVVQATEQVLSYIMLAGPQHRDCISWLPYQGIVPIGERLVHMTNRRFIMVRNRHKNETLLGRLDTNNKNTVKYVSLIDGPVSVKESPGSAVDFLVVSDICSVSWVPYVAGNPMPPRAVVGGRKWNNGPLVVAALWTTTGTKKMYSYGYYDPESQLGYMHKTIYRHRIPVWILWWKSETLVVLLNLQPLTGWIV